MLEVTFLNKNVLLWPKKLFNSQSPKSSPDHSINIPSGQGLAFVVHSSIPYSAVVRAVATGAIAPVDFDKGIFAPVDLRLLIIAHATLHLSVWKPLAFQ